MRNDRILRIYTDGGCAGNQSDENLGGWGAIMEFGGAQKELYGSERNTTNNRMEMTALLEAFKAIKKDGQMIQVFSDSSYLIPQGLVQKLAEKRMEDGGEEAGGKSGSVEAADTVHGKAPHIVLPCKRACQHEQQVGRSRQALCKVQGVERRRVFIRGLHVCDRKKQQGR